MRDEDREYIDAHYRANHGRPDKEVREEIQRLKSLKPVGKWANKTRQTILAIIDELECEFDRTAAEWSELPEHIRMARDDAMAWKDGCKGSPPSEGWGGLVEP